MKADELLNMLDDNDIINIMDNLGASTHTSAKGALVFESVCHGSNSHKLYWYRNSKRFTCF